LTKRIAALNVKSRWTNTHSFCVMTNFETAFDLLGRHYGEPPAAVGDTPWERLIGVLLSQQATPERANEALRSLREAGIDGAAALASLNRDELQELIAPAGAARPKADRLRKLAQHLLERAENRGDGDGATEYLEQLDTQSLREQLAAINGISHAAADAIALVFAEMPVFPVERAAHRVLKRHDWLDFDADDELLRDEVESGLGHDARRLRQFHAWIGYVGRDYCGQTPRCDDCPLAAILPEGGPRTPE
jgi:endonuclease III related protein